MAVVMLMLLYWGQLQNPMTNQAPFVGPGTLVVMVGGEAVSRWVLALVEQMVVVEE